MYCLLLQSLSLRPSSNTCALRSKHKENCLPFLVLLQAINDTRYSVFQIEKIPAHDWPCQEIKSNIKLGVYKVIVYHPMLAYVTYMLHVIIVVDLVEP